MCRYPAHLPFFCRAVPDFPVRLKSLLFLLGALAVLYFNTICFWPKNVVSLWYRK